MKEDLITILKDYVHGNHSDLTVDDELLKYAYMHQLEAIVYKVTKTPSLQFTCYSTIIAFEQRKIMQDKIKSILDQNGINYFFVKGMEVAAYYPDPAMKTMGDLDLTVPLEEKDKTADLLESIGFGTEGEGYRNFQGEWHLYYNNQMTELHHALLYGNEAGDAVNEPFLDYFSGCWDHVKDHKLDDSYHLLYMFVHLRKHILNKGVGLRQFLDIAFFSKADIDWKWLKKECKKLKLTDFVHNIYGLIYRWWDVSFPMTGTISDGFYYSATAGILEGGVFGNDDDLVKSRINQMTYNGQSILMQKFHFLFPTYSGMMKLPYCKGLKGKPYLYPYYWGKRIFINRKEFFKKMKFLQFGSKEVDQRMQELKEWGIQ